jgi:ribosome-associated protein
MYYDIERLRKSARVVDLEQLKAMLVEKTVAARNRPAKKAVARKAVAGKTIAKKAAVKKTSVKAGPEITPKAVVVRRKSAARKAGKTLE